ncbi:hypothetical protein ABPG72_021211 [Tetrahymena utriculariae]
MGQGFVFEFNPSQVHLTSLKSLTIDIHQNQIDEESLLGLSNFLTNRKNIKKLNLQFDHINFEVVSISSLANAFKICSNLQSLTLQMHLSQLGTQALQNLISKISSCYNLKNLTLCTSSNQMGASFISDFIFALGSCSNLKTLYFYLSSNNLYSSCAKSLGLAKQNCQNLEKDHLNILIWIAGSPCHYKEFHTKDQEYHYPEDDKDEIKALLQQISKLQIDIYFYKINDTTDTMIRQFKEYIQKYDRNLKKQNLEKKNFSIYVEKNYQTSTNSQSFSKFAQFVNILQKKKYIFDLKNKINIYQKMIIDYENLCKNTDNFVENYDYKNIQDTDTKKFDDLQKEIKKFRKYKFNLNKDTNKMERVCEEEINLEVTINVLGQGAFKEAYLAQDQDMDKLYALKKLKNSNQFDFDNLIIEYYIYLLSKIIRNNFLQELLAKTEKQHQKNFLMIVDDLWVVKDSITQQYYIKEGFKIGYHRQISTDGKNLKNTSTNQDLFQAFLQYSFEYSDYNYILYNQNGFGCTLNGISIHSQILWILSKVNFRNSLVFLKVHMQFLLQDTTIKNHIIIQRFSELINEEEDDSSIFNSVPLGRSQFSKDNPLKTSQQMQRIESHIFSYKNNKSQNLKNFLKLQQEIADFQILNKQAVSICFLVDATGSMEPYVSQVQEQINKIVDMIQSSSQQHMDVFISTVAYRDRNDENSFEKQNFTKCVDEFQQFLQKLDFSGGDDECEDVKIGLQQVKTLGWKEDHLNILIWIADAPCHGNEFHTEDEEDHYPDDDKDEIKALLQQISEQQIDIYFYKINDTTDTMIRQFKDYIQIYDRHLREQNFEEKNFSICVEKNFQSSTNTQTFSQFAQFVNKLQKTKQVEHVLNLKNKINTYQKMIIDHENLCKNIDNLVETYDYKSIQDTDIKNFDDLQKEIKKFRKYKFNLNKDTNKMDILSEEEINLEVTINVVGQGAFKEAYLAQDQDTGKLYALKKLKNSNQFDFDNLIIEYYIYLLSKSIRNSFLLELQAKTEKQKQKNLKICFDDLWIVRDSVTQQYYIKEDFKVGYQRYISTDGKSLQNSNANQDLFQAYLHYSFEYSDYNYILSDIQGFGSTLNDISIHSQKFIDSFQNINENAQLKYQFEFERQIDMKNIIINFPIYANLGILGIALFFNKHTCSSYCKTLQLKTIQQYRDLQEKESQQNNLHLSMMSISEQTEEINDGEDDFSTQNSVQRGRSQFKNDDPLKAVRKISTSLERIEQYGKIKEAYNI